MVSFLLLAALAAHTPVGPAVAPPTVGYAWQYRPSRMEHVAALRGLTWVRGQDGWASVPDCRRLGQMVFVAIADRRGRWHNLWLRITDCSRSRDIPGQRAKHLILEVSGTLAIRLGWDHYTLDGPGHARARIYFYVRRGP